MRTADFEALVREAVESIPEFFQEIMSNVDFLVRRQPLKRQIKEAALDEGDLLLGLYEGFPITEGFDGNMSPPDIITIFQGPIEEVSNSNEEIRQQIRTTVIHEVAHFFGISDAELYDWGLY
jgi:predicted Zn-dependent protease with MMP-like domain